MPAKNEDAAIKTTRFVYETEYKRLRQPFIHPIYVLHLVTRGSAEMTLCDRKYTLACGDIFFAFPGVPYRITGSEDFAYIYICFMGTRAQSVLARCHVAVTSPHYTGYSALCPFFEDAIRRLSPKNANILTESVLLYALSFLTAPDDDEPHTSDSLLRPIVDYVDRHYRESDMSLGRLADTFSYTEKYLSQLFRKHLRIGFNCYLNNLRVQYANELICKKHGSIAEIAAACGYEDALYFSKVYKKHTGNTPTHRMRLFAADEKRSRRIHDKKEN